MGSEFGNSTKHQKMYHSQVDADHGCGVIQWGMNNLLVFTPQKKSDPPILARQLSIGISSSTRGEASRAPLPSAMEFLTGLTLFGSCTGKHICPASICRTVRPRPDASILQLSSSSCVEALNCEPISTKG